ncbi:hypothetical protein FE782_12645 [Paenibacillus antri]|uniref:Uncharacterized protein n=1 Tax=Paenibacillus antri TaxID=2582848 RepID=A0A5R9G9J1_9BACL|nr:hypothetical protein FE782_12645 [Paenibacillus antri]
MKGTMNGGGTTTVRRSFPVAPGETIRKGDVVTVFDDLAYKNAELPLDALPKFSPDVLYLRPDEQSRAVHAIGSDEFIQIASTDHHIRIARLAAGPDGIVEKAGKLLPVFGVEGIDRILFKPLDEGTGLLCYLEHNTVLWRFLAVRWAGGDGLELGGPFVTELSTNGLPEIESAGADSFLMVWHCVLAEPPRMKARLGAIGSDLSVAMPADAYAFEGVPLLSDRFAFAKLGEGRYVVNCFIGDPQPTVATQALFVREGRIELGGRAVWRPPASKNVEMRALALSPDRYILLNKTESRLDIYNVAMLNDVPSMAAPFQVTVSGLFFDAVRLSDRRFAVAYNDRNAGSLTTTMFEASATGNAVLSLFSRGMLGTIRGNANRLRFVSLGESLYVLTFNSEASSYADYTQALLLRMTADMTAFEDVLVKEQLTNVWDRGCEAEYFHFCALGTTGRFIVSGSGRMKLFRCGWTPLRFIDAGVGEFSSETGDYYSSDRLFDVVALSNGYVVLAYRERDTWHGKLSVFEPRPGGYRPIASHTFSYSHVDNLAIVEIAPGKIALQYRQRIKPTYDSGGSEREVKVLVAKVTSEGLTEKATTSFEPEPYKETRLFPLAGDRLLVLGLNHKIDLFARVFRYREAGATPSFEPLGEALRLDYERANFTAARLGPNLFAATSAGSFLVEAREDGTLISSGRLSLETSGSETHGMLDEEDGHVACLLTDSASGAIETVRYAKLGGRLFQAGDAAARKEKLERIVTELRRMRGKTAFVYKARWTKGMTSQPGRPASDLRLALLDAGSAADGAPPKDRFYPFPSSPGTPSVFLPIDDRRAFCAMSDGRNNQIYTIAYLDDAFLAFGRPYVTPSGIAGSDGTEGQSIEVTLRGIAEVPGATLQAGTAYASGRDGRLSVEPGGRTVGVAVSASELLIE